MDKVATGLESWKSYAAWRRTKCRPFYKDVLDTVFKYSANQNERDSARTRLVDEINQATLEFVGELAELSNTVNTLIAEIHETGKITEYSRRRMIDECGDALFTGCWSLDAWGHNPLSDADAELGLEITSVQENESFVAARDILRDRPEFLKDPEALRLYGSSMICLMNSAQTYAGLTADALKKILYQHRDQDSEVMADHALEAMGYVSVVLFLIDSSVGQALAANRKKLDARYPDGYRPGVGGGIRAGDGK